MNSFPEEISSLKRLVRIKRVTQTILVASVIFLFIHAVTTGLDKLGIPLFKGEALTYAIFAGISLILAIFITYFQRKRFVDILIDIDARLNLKERISTAYEYCLLEKRSEFVDLLISDAGNRLRSIDKKKIFPIKFSFIHLLISLLVLVNILIFLVDYLAAVPSHDRVDPNTLERVDSLLKDYSSDKQDIGKRREQKKQDNIRKQLEDISKKLDERKLSRQRIYSSVNKLLEEIRSEKLALSQDLSSKIDVENAEGITALKMHEIKKLSQFNINKLEGMLNRMFDNRIPDSIMDDLAILKENQSLEELLKQILHDLDQIFHTSLTSFILILSYSTTISPTTRPPPTWQECEMIWAVVACYRRVFLVPPHTWFLLMICEDTDTHIQRSVFPYIRESEL